MPQKVLKFTGINRMVNEFQNSGACEELINLRPKDGGGYRVVKNKSIFRNTAIRYDGLYEHSFGDTNNLLGIKDGVVDLIYSNGMASTISSRYQNKTVSLSSAGNVLVIYCEEDKTQAVFKYDDGRYSSFNISIMPITDISISYSYNPNGPVHNQVAADDSSVEAHNAALQKAASGFYGKYPQGLCGAAMVGCTYVLDDGSEVWSTAFVVANAARINGYVAPVLKENNEVWVSGASMATLNIEFSGAKPENIKKVNIYASRPVFPYEVEYTGGSSHRIKELLLKDINLGGQLMYYQGSIIPTEGEISFRLNFGAEQTGNALMEVTSGCVERAGNAVSYNNRFHYYRSEVQHIVQIPTISDWGDPRVPTSDWIAYVKINDKWILVNEKYRFSESVPNDFVYPMANVEQLAFVKANNQEDGFTVPYEEMFYVNMENSSAYNYSYAFNFTPTLTSASGFRNMAESSGQLWGDEFTKKVLWNKELNAINVSAQFNPFVFPVEYSYSFSGEILDVATSYIPISSSQIGQYPLNVFTSNGIFALEQGDGSVLYSNIIPIQPQVITGKATSTPEGTYFISSKNLYLLSGVTTINLSRPLDGVRELTLREQESYKALLVDFSSLLSKEDFEDYVDNVVLVYDQLQNELLISSTKEDVDYSYVLNLNTRAFHKISKKYSRAQNGTRYVIEDEGASRNIVDLHNEEHSVKQPILLQSRPISLEVFYTHIQRLLLFADTQLSGDQYLMLSVFGGDNLYDWKCIISSQKHDVALRHIRTNKAAKSYKDYVILINGVVDTNTDLSDLIADYTVVSRRLG